MQQIKKQYRVNFKKTLENLKAAADKLRITIPPQEEGQKPKHRDIIKQSVFDTAKNIYALQISNLKKLSKPGPVALRTKNGSLAKYSRHSERTTRRHLDILIKHGIIQAKARLGHGIQLMLNAAILAYDEIAMAVHPPATPKAPTIAPEPPQFKDLNEMQNAFLSLFSMNRPLSGS